VRDLPEWLHGHEVSVTAARPIIEQDVAQVGHADGAGQMAAIGRDVGRLVLSWAVRLYAEDRVLLVGDRNVVFS
jgi:formyltetrahydrofolate deformylase